MSAMVMLTNNGSYRLHFNNNNISTQKYFSERHSAKPYNK